MLTLKEYNYEYESGVIVRATESAITPSGEIVTSKSLINSVRYTYDSETSLYYLNSRYYDPETGRFVNGDEVMVAILGEEATAFNIFAYCKNTVTSLKDPYGYLYISYQKLKKVFNSLSDMSKAFRINTSKGLWGTLAIQAAPYILSLFCWINTIPIVGQIIFGLVAYATVKFASYAVTAYYLKKKGLDLSIKWRWFVPYLKVTYK